jgi:hypothetical protein
MFSMSIQLFCSHTDFNAHPGAAWATPANPLTFLTFRFSSRGLFERKKVFVRYDEVLCRLLLRLPEKGTLKQKKRERCFIKQEARWGS